MIIKKFFKSVFRILGFDIVKLVTPVPEVIIQKTQEDEEKEKNQLLQERYIIEGKRFEWLRSYNFKTILDIGANEGQFASKILTIFPEAEIHCFEPLHSVFEQLQLNFKNISNVVVYNFGLGASTEEKNIFRNEYSASSSVLEMLDLHKENFDFAVAVEPEKISIKKLDEVFITEIPKPLLIKIDVQGYEMYVLEGGKSAIPQAEVIIIETSFYPFYDNQPLFDDIYQYFTQWGYRYVGNIEQLEAPKDQKILQADAIFVKGTDVIHN